MISLVIFYPDHSFKWYNAFCLTKKLFIKVSMVRHSRLGIFYFKEKFCVSHASASRLQDISKAFQRPCRKNYISSKIWHKSFIQTIKCFFFNQLIVYQSFYGLVIFLLQGKFCYACVSKSCHFRDVSFESVQFSLSYSWFKWNSALCSELLLWNEP